MTIFMSPDEIKAIIMIANVIQVLINSIIISVAMILISDVVVCINEDSRASFTMLISKVNLDKMSPRVFLSTALIGVIAELYLPCLFLMYR